MKFAGGVGRVFHRRLGLRDGSGAKSAVFQVTLPGDLEPPSPSHPHVHAHGTFHWHWAPLDAPCRLSTVSERRQKGSNRGFGRKWAIVHRMIDGELMSDTIFFQILESGSLVDLHTKFGGSNSKARKKCHWDRNSVADGSGQTVRPSVMMTVTFDRSERSC